MSGLTRLSLLCVFAFTLLLASACAAPAAPDSAMQTPVAEVAPVEPGALAVTNVFARPSPMQAGNGAVYLNFDNAAALTIDVPVAASDEAMPAPMATPLPAHAELAPAGPTLADVQSDGIHGWLSCTPTEPTPGEAAIDAYLVADDGQPIEDATVTFDIDMTNMSHGQYRLPAEPAGAGHYVGSVHFSMPGPWRIIAVVVRPGSEPVELRFEFKVNRG